jgi:RHS repeat-associated protein
MLPRRGVSGGHASGVAGQRVRVIVHSRKFRLIAAGVSVAVGLSLFSSVPDPFRSGLPGPSYVPGRAAVTTPRQLTAPVTARPHLVPASVTAADRALRVPGRVPPPPREGSRGTSHPPPPPKGTVPPERFNVPHSSAHSGLHPPPSPRGSLPGLPPVPAQHPLKVQGYVPGTSKLLPASAGRAFARVFQNADGTKTADVYQHPVNYQLPDGTWAPINTTLVRAGTGAMASPASSQAAATAGNSGADWQVAADSLMERFAPAGTASGLAVLGFGNGATVGFGVLGAAPVAGEVSASSITYPGIMPSADLSLTALPGGGAKEQIILTSPNAPATWQFPLNLQGLTASVDAAGRVLFTDAGGNVVAWFPHGFMTDSNIDPHSDIGAYSDGVTYQVHRDSSGSWVLTMSLDEAWLADPARVFPVTVDPTALWNYGDSHDTFVQTGYTTSNSTSAELRIGTWDGGSDYAATYLDFSALSSELSNDTIYGATLYMDEIWSYSCTAEPVGVYKVTQSWSAGSIANYPGPSYNSTALGTAKFAAGYTGCPNPAWEHIDLGSAGTSLVQSWANGGNNYGLTVRAPTSGQVACGAAATVDCGWKKFDSDNAAYGLNAPYLAVTYSPYNASYAFTSSTPTVSPAVTNNQAGYVDVKVTNKGHDTWTPTNGYMLQYEVYDASTGSQEPVAPAQTVMPSNVAPGSTVTVHAKIAPIAPGSYDIKFDMIYVTSNGYALFSDWGVPRTADLALTVQSIPPSLTAMYPLNNYQVDTLTPQLFAAATSVDDWPSSTVNYWFSLCAGPYGNFSWCVSSPWQASQVWQVPAGKLAWNTDYYWTVWAQDAGGYGTQASATGPWYLLETAVPQPVVTSHLAAGEAAGGTLNPVMGNYSTTVTDASVATAGPPLAVTRSYNSLDPRTSGLFGAGWSTLYDMQVTPDGGGTGSVVVTMPDGTQARFAQNSDGSYSPQQGMFATLASVTGGGWQLMDKSSTVYDFNAAGQLTAITDNRGRMETLAYASGQLATITSASGRALHLTWSGGHVASVSTDPVGGSPLTWTYTYSGDSLTKVCSPAAAPDCTSYSYSTGSHLKTTLTDSGPVGYWPLDDTSGTTAVSAIGANLGADDGNYYSSVTLGVDAGPGAGSSGTAADFGGGSSRVYLPVNTLTELGPFLTAEAWFKTTSDGVILSYQDTYISSTPAHYTPVLYVGTDGKLRGQFWAGTKAPITSTQAVNDGRWHQAILSGNATTQTLYLDGAQAGTLTGSAPISAPTQDQAYIGDGYATGWPGTPSAGGTFAFTGDIADVALYDTPLGPAAATEHHQAAQQATQLTTITLPSGRIQAQLAYNTAADRVATETDSQGGTWTLGTLSYGGTAGSVTATARLTDPRGGTITSVYDPLRGYHMTSQIDQAGGTTTWDYNTAGFVDYIHDPNGDPTGYWLDARGNITGQATERSNGTWYASWYDHYLDTANPFDPRNDQMTAYADARSSGALDGTYLTTWGYDSFGDITSEQLPATPGFPNGRTLSWMYTTGTEPAVGGGSTPPGLLASSTDAGGHVTSYGYDSAGDLMRRTDPNGLVTAYSYDAIGRRTSMTVTSSAYPGGVTTTYTYDPLGRLLTQTGPGVPNAVTSVTHTARTTYTYDPDGNVLTAAISDTTGGDATRTTTRTYNGNGELATLTDPAGAVASYTYDAAGNIATVTDPVGNTYAYSYTPTSQVATKTLENWIGNPFSPSPAANLVLDSYSYDPGGRLASVTDSMGRTTSYTYYLDNLLATVTATGARLNGSTSPADVVLHAYTYDGAGNLTQDAAGGGLSTTNQTWDAGNRVTSTTLDPAGLDRVTSYTYDADSNLTSVVRSGAGSAGSRETDYSWDSGNYLTGQTVKNGSQDLVTTDTVDQFGHLTSITDPRGNVTGASAASYTATMTYDPAGNLQTITAPPVQVTQNGATPSTAQPVVTFGYDTFGDKAQTRNPLGQVTVAGYDGAGRVTSTTQPAYTPPGGTPITPVTRTAYDGNGNVTSVTDPAGNTWTRSYDQLSDLVRVTDPPVGGIAGQWNYGYDTNGEQTAAVSPTGAQTQATYDDLGRQITATQVERTPANAAFTTALAYDTAGNLTTSTDPLGSTTSHTYDAAKEVTRTTDPLGHVTTDGYDGYGDLTTTTNPLGDTATAVYDPAGRQTSISQADPSGTVLATTSFGYDPAGNQTSVTDPDGNTTTSSYDAADQLTSVTTPITSTASDTVRYGYDAAGQRTLVTDGNGNPTVTTYNSLGLPESVILPPTTAYPAAASRTFTTSYDADGRTVSQSQPGGISQTWAYDSLGDLTGQTGSGAAVATTARTLGYNLSGQLTSYGSPGGTVSISYNDRGAPLSVTGGGQPAQSYGYDGDGQLISRTDAAGTAAFGYDAAGRLASMTDPVTGAALGYGYDAAGEQTTVSYGSGADSQALAYDALGRVTSDSLKTAGGTTIASAAYTWDPAGNLTGQATTGTAGAGTNSYTYDQAGWLTSWTPPSGSTTSYGYDNAGNLTSAGPTTYSYNQRDQLTAATTASGTTSYTYAPSGTLSQVATPSGSTSYAFDAYGQLATAGTVSYSYDALGRLATRSGSGGTTTFAYDTPAALSPAAILSPTGQVSQAYSRDPAGNLVSAATGGTAAAAWTSPVHGDVTALFSPAATTLTASAAYDPWGNITATAGTMPALGFQGGYTDPATGLVSMGARWYNPATGGFTTTDTLLTTPGPGNGTPATAGDPLAGDGPGPYGYAADNPLTITDPTGHCFLFCWSTVGAALTGFLKVAEPATGLGTGAEVAGGLSIAGEAGLVTVFAAAFLFFDASPTASGCGVDIICSPPPLGAYSMFPNWPRTAQGRPARGGGVGSSSGGGFGGGGGYPVIIICGQACQQAQHVLANENIVLAKPHEKPAISQAQLNQRRDKTERTFAAQQAKQIYGKANSFQGRNADSRIKPIGGGGPPGNGIRPPTGGCFSQPPEESPRSQDSIFKANDSFTEIGKNVNDLAKLFHRPPTAPTVPYGGSPQEPSIGPAAHGAGNIGMGVAASLMVLYAIWLKIQQMRGGDNGPEC